MGNGNGPRANGTATAYGARQRASATGFGFLGVWRSATGSFWSLMGRPQRKRFCAGTSRRMPWAACTLHGRMRFAFRYKGGRLTRGIITRRNTICYGGRQRVICGRRPPPKGASVPAWCLQNASLSPADKSLVLASAHGSLGIAQTARQLPRFPGPMGGSERRDIGPNAPVVWPKVLYVQAGGEKVKSSPLAYGSKARLAFRKAQEI